MRKAILDEFIFWLDCREFWWRKIPKVMALIEYFVSVLLGLPFDFWIYWKHGMRVRNEQ